MGSRAVIGGRMPGSMCKAVGLTVVGAPSVPQAHSACGKRTRCDGWRLKLYGIAVTGTEPRLALLQAARPRDPRDGRSGGAMWSGLFMGVEDPRAWSCVMPSGSGPAVRAPCAVNGRLKRCYTAPLPPEPTVSGA